MRIPGLVVPTLTSLLLAGPQLAQSGAIQVFQLDDTVSETEAFFDLAAPRKVFRFMVPPGGTLTVTLEHPKKSVLQLTKATFPEFSGKRQSGWERRFPVNGKLTHTNSDKEPQDMYFMVADPTEVSSAKEPYKVKVTRSWVPEKK